MHWEVVLTSFFLMLISSITICIGNRKLIGKEVMEIDDLMLFEEETNKVTVMLCLGFYFNLSMILFMLT